MDCRTLSSSPTIIFIIRQPNNFTNKVKIGSDATTSVIISSDFLIVRILGNYYSCSLSVTQDSWLSHGLNPLPCPFLPIKTPPNPPSITISMCQLGFCVKARAMPTFWVAYAASISSTSDRVAIPFVFPFSQLLCHVPLCHLYVYIYIFSLLACLLLLKCYAILHYWLCLWLNWGIVFDAVSQLCILVSVLVMRKSVFLDVLLGYK